MRITTLFWIVWILSILFLITMIFFPRMSVMILFGLILVMIGFNMYVYQSERKPFQKILEAIEKLNFDPIEKGIRKMGEEQTDYLTKIFKLEMDIEGQKKEIEKIQEKIEKLPKDQEMKYREMARKLLDLDNKMNEKFKLLGEAVLRLSKEKREE